MTDSELVSLYLARDEAAVAQTAEKYGARLRGLARSILDDEHAAEECENDVYLAAWNSIPPHEPRDYLFAYLPRIARHTAIDRCRARSRRPESLAELDECLPGPDRAEDRVNGQAMAAALNAFLRGLPEQKRTLFLRRYWYCDSIRTLCERTGWNESRVKTALHRMRAALREQLRKEGFPE